MPGSASAHDRPALPRRDGAHGLLVAGTDRERRVGAAAWVDRQLAGGAKVYYKGWLDDGEDPRDHWIVGHGGAPSARGALAAGQLEIMGFPEVVRRCGGATEAYHHLLHREVEQAITRQGWGRVALSQESACRPMADEAEAAEFAAQEAAYDDLARAWPVTTLCQLTLADENVAAIWESAALHHHQIVDPQWSTSTSRSRWWLRGTLDAHVTERFGAALYGALREALLAADGPDLHVDLSGVEFADLAFVQTLFLSARAVAAHQRVVLHGCPPFLASVLDTVGRPRSVLLVDDVGDGGDGGDGGR